MLAICIPFTSPLNPSGEPGGREAGRGTGGRSVTLLAKRCRSQNVGIGVGAAQRWSRATRAAPLSGAPGNLESVKLNGVRRLPEPQGGGGGGRRIGARESREDAEIEVRVGVFLGSGLARPRLPQSSLAGCGVGLLRCCLGCVVPPVLPRFGGPKSSLASCWLVPLVWQPVTPPAETERRWRVWIWDVGGGGPGR